MKRICYLVLAAGLMAGCDNKDEAQKSSPPATSPAPAAPAAVDTSSPGGKFLADNAKKEGVKSTASGLQYKVISSGTGDMPKATDTVSVHYEGTLIDGTVFDSSIKRGAPISFPVNGVIQGWQEALQLMKVGDKWQLFIPPNLAYGANPPTPAIPPNSVLIFQVELLGIQK